RIGKIEGDFVVNPSEESLLEDTDLDLIVAGTEDAILMVEARANEIPEAEILDALDIAHDAIKKLCAAQRELASKAGKEKLVIEAPQIDADLLAQVQAPHGSALFTRGQTQALSVAALGTLKEEMRLDTLGLETKKYYWHHYNFPPFSVGEAGFMRGPKRRDIGHGALAERALVPMIPSIDEFPYTIRVVSDILESNGP